MHMHAHHTYMFINISYTCMHKHIHKDRKERRKVGEMTQSVQYLLYKHEVMNLIPELI